MNREVLVYVDLNGVPHLTGRLWSRPRKNKESATFEYDPDWLRHPARFALEPSIQRRQDQQRQQCRRDQPTYHNSRQRTLNLTAG